MRGNFGHAYARTHALHRARAALGQNGRPSPLAQHPSERREVPRCHPLAHLRPPFANAIANAPANTQMHIPLAHEAVAENVGLVREPQQQVQERVDHVPAAYDKCIPQFAQHATNNGCPNSSHSNARHTANGPNTRAPHDKSLPQFALHTATDSTISRPTQTATPTPAPCDKWRPQFARHTTNGYPNSHHTTNAYPNSRALYDNCIPLIRAPYDKCISLIRAATHASYDARADSSSSAVSLYLRSPIREFNFQYVPRECKTRPRVPQRAPRLDGVPAHNAQTMTRPTRGMHMRMSARTRRP